MSERAKVRAGSYHTRPENHANHFEEVYPLSKSEEKESRSLECEGLVGRTNAAESKS